MPRHHHRRPLPLSEGLSLSTERHASQDEPARTPTGPAAPDSQAVCDAPAPLCAGRKSDWEGRARISGRLSLGGFSPRPRHWARLGKVLVVTAGREVEARAVAQHPPWSPGQPTAKAQGREQHP